MRRYRVFSLGVWGHASDECKDYDCPCITLAEDGCEDEGPTHDDDRCQCYFDVNDRFSAGTVEVDEDTEAGLLAALIAQGYLKNGVTLNEAAIVNHGNGFEGIDDAKNGRPIFQLESEDPS